jgi:FtsP/CotA-like multicopper oxidase with cupredoxin domain
VHLHGHHFRVTGADGRGPRKDTASVPARGGELVLDFVAGNPGDWMLHCHNHWHMEDGMARTIRYRTEGGDPA